MALPEKFDPWEHLQDQLKRHHNKLVNRWWRNIEDNSIDTPRKSLKHACKIDDNDTAVMTLLRLWLFEITAGHAQSIQRPVYGIPIDEHDIKTPKFHPQIKLHFYEDLADVDEGMRPIEGEISIRLMQEDSESITRAKCEIYARDIKRIWATPPYRWHKGWHLATYTDTSKGYRLKLFCYSKNEAKDLVRNILELQSHIPEWENFVFKENESPSEAYPTNPGTWRLYGKTQRKPRKRPRGYVIFKYADLLVWGMRKPITLLDSTLSRRNAIDRF